MKHYSSYPNKEKEDLVKQITGEIDTYWPSQCIQAKVIGMSKIWYWDSICQLKKGSTDLIVKPGHLFLMPLFGFAIHVTTKTKCRWAQVSHDLTLYQETHRNSEYNNLQLMCLTIWCTCKYRQRFWPGVQKRIKHIFGKESISYKHHAPHPKRRILTDLNSSLSLNAWNIEGILKYKRNFSVTTGNKYIYWSKPHLFIKSLYLKN